MTTRIEPIELIFGTHVIPITRLRVRCLQCNRKCPTRRRTPDKADKASRHRVDVRQTWIFSNNIPLPGGDLFQSVINRFTAIFLARRVFRTICFLRSSSLVHRSAATGHTVSVFARLALLPLSKVTYTRYPL